MSEKKSGYNLRVLAQKTDFWVLEHQLGEPQYKGKSFEELWEEHRLRASLCTMAGGHVVDRYSVKAKLIEKAKKLGVPIVTAMLAALMLCGCPIRIDPPPPSSCLRQPNCGQCASHSTTAEEGSTSRESGRFCVWCDDGCFPEGHDCAGPVTTLLELCP